MNKKKKYTFTAITYTFLWIAVILIINLIAGTLSDKVNLKLDLTKDSLLQFSDETNSVVKKLNMDVHIISLLPTTGSEREMQQIDEILTKYDTMSDKISYEKVDPVKNPGVLSKYQVDGKPLQSRYNIIFETKRMYTIVDINDVIYVEKYADKDEMFSYALRGEQCFSSAIVKVTEGNEINMSVVSGHGERLTAENFKNSILPGAGYSFNDINLSSDEIGKSTDVLILTTPKIDYSPQEIDKIDAFCAQGKSLQVYYDAFTEETPNLNAYLQEWGVSFGQGVVCDEDAKHYNNYKMYLIPDMPENDITKSMGENLKIVVPVSCPVFAQTKDNSNVIVLAATGDQGFVKKNTDSDMNQFVQGDEKTKSDVAVMVSKPNPDGTVAKLLAVGTSYFLGDYSTADSPFEDLLEITANRKFLTSTLSYMTDQPAEMYIMPKNIYQDKVVISQKSIFVYAVATIVVIPIVLLTLGLVLWIRRRHL